MNGTPRLRSAFPTTPTHTPGKSRGAYGNGTSRLGASLPQIPTVAAQEPSEPFIPFDKVDAPTQRLYVAAFYVLLWGWRLYDWGNLQHEQTESFWLFLKWLAIDGVFLWGMPGLRVPWLEWSTGTITALFSAHALMDWMLMFRIGIPLTAVLASFLKLLWDSGELAISEHHVKPDQVLNNASLILGRQIINILPEGSAILNPHRETSCIGPNTNQILIPIQINQTTPISIDLFRIDIHTDTSETITLGSSALKKLKKEAERNNKAHRPEEPLLLQVPVKKTGIYKLHKVIDESKLEVRRSRYEMPIVACPQARVKPTGHHRCKGDLANVALEVSGTPPLKIKFRKMVNEVERENTFQSIQPDDFVSPLQGQQGPGPLVLSGDGDVSWAKSQTITVPLNETLGSSGHWTYSVEEVQDALGNVISYAAQAAEEEYSAKPKPKAAHLYQALAVHERPQVALYTHQPLQVPKGEGVPLPVTYKSTGKHALTDTAHNVEYWFTAEKDLLPTGDHSDAVQIMTYSVKNTRDQVRVEKAGLYTLKSVWSDHCAGEVLEPASVLLQNPPEPDLSVSTEEIYDKCAGNPVGLRVALDLIGTPPFTVQYKEEKRGERHHSVRSERVLGMKGQIEFTPPEAGHYTYTFLEVTDAVYQQYPLKHKHLVLEQDVKPSASARLLHAGQKIDACMDQAVTFDVKLLGEGPWTLEYELVHAGKRKKYAIKDVADDKVQVQTEPLSNGGEYTFSLASVTDRLGCKEFLKEEAKIYVRHERPKGYFGQVEGRRSVRTLEGKRVQLPLRLTGEKPWHIKFRNLNDTSGNVVTHSVSRANEEISINTEGTYELLEINDKICPGVVDELANQFEVKWIPRPRISIAKNPAIDLSHNKYTKQDVCEGDEDSFDVTFKGSPPFEVKYEEHYKPSSGTRSLKRKEFNAALGVASIPMDTSKSGHYEYRFTELGDYNYDHSTKHHHTLSLEQRVNPRPAASFKEPGKTYSFCAREEEGAEVIPITFIGVAPFDLEVEVKHYGTARPEIVSFANIPTNNHQIRIPHNKLNLGTSALSIRTVRDSRGCQARPQAATSHRVQIAVHDAPSISPLDGEKADYCVGERLSFALSGVTPFEVLYTFNGREQKARSPETTFRRLAEKPGSFRINSIRDSSSNCRGSSNIPSKTIHPMPSVKVSKGREAITDIHEGGEAEILFEFTGTPPFEFTYTRSENTHRSGKRGKVLETHAERSEGYEMRITASEEGVYEVISIKDRWCSFSLPGGQHAGVKGQKLLQN